MKKTIGKITLIKGLKKATGHFKEAQRVLEFADTDPCVEPLQKCIWITAHTRDGKNGLPDKCKEVGCDGWGSPKACPLGRFLPLVDGVDKDK